MQQSHHVKEASEGHQSHSGKNFHAKTDYETNPPSSNTGSLPGQKKKNCKLDSPPPNGPNEEGRWEISPESTPMQEKIQDKFSLFCLNEKEETYCRAYDSCKSTIDLTLVNISIDPEIIWSMKYDLKGNEHFPMKGKPPPNNSRDGA